MKYLLVFIISFNCFADEWRTEDTQRETVYMALHVMDWAQTRNIARNPDRWYEANIILGKHPSVDKVDAYFALMGLAHYYVSKSLPVEYRSAWQYFSVCFEVGMVGRNLQFGVGIEF